MAGNPTLVLAFFESEETADGAAGALLGWAKGNRRVQLDAVGVLVKDAQGDVKTHKLGPREGKKGIGVGAVLGAVAAIAQRRAHAGRRSGARRRGRRPRRIPLPPRPPYERGGRGAHRVEARRRPRCGRRARPGEPGSGSLRGARGARRRARAARGVARRRRDDDRDGRALAVPRACDGFEPCVNVERAQKPPDVVPHRFRTEVQLAGDLLRRPAVLEHAQDLGLARRQ